MSTPNVTRRLAAILIADVVGYSRLMERDDTGTFSRLRNIRDEVVDPAIVSHDGRIVKTAGDGLVAEFASALAALRAAVQVQREMATRNADVPKDDRIAYRIGINLGDVMVDGSDLAGDGINVAARLETLAEPGGICVSGSVREQVHGTLDVDFEDIGDQQVKNIARPIRAFAVRLGGENAEGASADPRARHSLRARVAASRVPAAGWRRRGLMVALIALVAAAVAAFWGQIRMPSTPNPPALSVGIVPLVASAGSPVSSSQRDSLTHDVATQLARAYSVIRIVPAPSPIPGKSDEGSILLAQHLDVRYLLEGDVQQEKDKVEVRLRLVNGASGAQVWSETVSLEQQSDLRAQRRALRRAMERVVDRVYNLEMQRAAALGDKASTPIDMVLRANSFLASGTTRSLDTFRRMESLCEAALKRDPDLVPALRCVRNALDGQLDMDSTVDRKRLIARMDEVSAKAVNLDRGSWESWDARAGVLMYMGRWDAALEASSRALELDPDGAIPLQGRAWAMTMIGRPAEAVKLAHEAIAMDPPGDWWVVRAECEALLLLGQYAEAVTACERASGRSGSDFDIAYFLAAAYAHTGNLSRAREEAAKILKGAPGFTIATLKAKQYSTHPEYMRLAEEHWYSGLRKAGIPDQ